MKKLFLAVAALAATMTASAVDVDMSELNIYNDSSATINITNRVNLALKDTIKPDGSADWIEYYAVTATVEASFSINGTPISISYTNTQDDNKLFAKSYGTYIQPNGSNMYLHIATNAGDAVVLSFKEYTSGTAVFEITGASETSATLTGLAETLTLNATGSEIVLKNTSNKYQLLSVTGSTATVTSSKDAISSDLLKLAGDVLVNPTNLEVEVYSIAGVKVLSSSEASINVSSLKGAYVVKTAEGTMKFVK